jgi:uncharacterized protein YkwD
MESEVVRRVNQVRGEHGAPPLRGDPALTRVAREYSCALARRDTLSHTGASGQTVADRIRAAGKTYREVGENLASTLNARDPVRTAVEGWMQSPGHRQNILRETFTETGVGICRDAGGTLYFTQLFLRPA